MVWISNRINRFNWNFPRKRRRNHEFERKIWIKWFL